MKHATIIFPHQLFEIHPALAKERSVYLLEHEHFFTRFLFHKQKLIFHYASLQEYENYLMKEGFHVHMCSYDTTLETIIKKEQISHIHYADLHDTILEKTVTHLCAQLGLERTVYTSSYFLTPQDMLQELLSSKRFFMASFYQKQRKRLGLLMKEGKPLGGSYSFDVENRQRLPTTIRIPSLPLMPSIDSVRQARSTVEKHFAKNPGSTDLFIYPVNFKQAKAWLSDFLKHRLLSFGHYQDALKIGEPFLFHSVLSPLLNSGLLTPHFVVDHTLAYAAEHKIPLASLEGFIRQIIGWREFVYAVYREKGEAQRSSNYFHHTFALPRSFAQGTTGFFPVDECIKHVHHFAYAHHIERLMVFGNFLLLTETDPNEVFRWFMEFFIDAYDWVMVPNVYGMSQYADGGLMVTKPYISSSHYLKKMSNYPAGPWTDKLDALYWYFLHKNEKKCAASERLRLSLAALHTMPKQKLTAHIKTAHSVLNELHSDAW